MAIISAEVETALRAVNYRHVGTDGLASL